MIKKVVRTMELDSFSSIRDSRDFAICSMGKKMIKLKKISDVRNHKVIALGKFDDKRRLIIPLEIRQQTQEFEVFVFNGDLILKEAHE